MLDLVANRLMCGGPGVTTPPISGLLSTDQDTDGDTDGETAPTRRTGKLTKRYRESARPIPHKNADELNHRVSISNNEYASVLFY